MNGKGLVLAFFSAFFFLPAPFQGAEIEVASFPLPKETSSYERIRVAILQNRDEVKLSINAPYQVETIQSRAVIDRGSKLPDIRVAPLLSGLRFGLRDLKLYGIKIVSPRASIRVDNKDYPDSIQIIKDKQGKLTVVNEVDLESYLRRVLPKEMLRTWPVEALKAQAVASRTFALFKSLSKGHEDYMLAGDVIGQVYGGRGSEAFATDQAVNQTRGEILTYHDEVFPAYFHSTCAGRTTHPEYNWDIQPHPALQGVRCWYCLNSKHYRWRRVISSEDLGARLKRGGYSLGRIQQVIPKKWDESGRAREILIKHSRGELVLRANDFRLAAGPDIVKSIKDIRVSYSDGHILFSGYGWGHGVGMCQWGAKALAEQGKTYREILEFYYPGARITKIK